MNTHKSTPANSTTTRPGLWKPTFDGCKWFLVMAVLSGCAWTIPAGAAEDGRDPIEEVLSREGWRMWLVTPFRPNVLSQCKDIHENPMFEGLSGQDKQRLVEKRRLDVPLVIKVGDKAFTMKPGSRQDSRPAKSEGRGKKGPASGKETPAYQAQVIPREGTCFVLEAEGKARYSGAVVLAGGIHNLPFPSLLLDPFSPSDAPEFKWVKTYFQPSRQK